MGFDPEIYFVVLSEVHLGHGEKSHTKVERAHRIVCNFVLLALENEKKSSFPFAFPSFFRNFAANRIKEEKYETD